MKAPSPSGSKAPPLPPPKSVAQNMFDASAIEPQDREIDCLARLIFPLPKNLSTGAKADMICTSSAVLGEELVIAGNYSFSSEQQEYSLNILNGFKALRLSNDKLGDYHKIEKIFFEQAKKKMTDILIQDCSSCNTTEDLFQKYKYALSEQKKQLDAVLQPLLDCRRVGHALLKTPQDQESINFTEVLQKTPRFLENQDGVHAEIRILQEADTQTLLVEGSTIAVGVSKLSCAPCYVLVEALKEKTKAQITLPGTHGKEYFLDGRSTWTPPKFPRTELSSIEIDAQKTRLTSRFPPPTNPKEMYSDFYSKPRKETFEHAIFKYQKDLELLNNKAELENKIRTIQNYKDHKEKIVQQEANIERLNRKLIKTQEATTTYTRDLELYLQELQKPEILGHVSYRDREDVKEINNKSTIEEKIRAAEAILATARGGVGEKYKKLKKPNLPKEFTNTESLNLEIESEKQKLKAFEDSFGIIKNAFGALKRKDTSVTDQNYGSKQISFTEQLLQLNTLQREFYRAPDESDAHSAVQPQSASHQSQQRNASSGGDEMEEAAGYDDRTIQSLLGVKQVENISSSRDRSALYDNDTSTLENTLKQHLKDIQPGQTSIIPISINGQHYAGLVIKCDPHGKKTVYYTDPASAETRSHRPVGSDDSGYPDVEAAIKQALIPLDDRAAASAPLASFVPINIPQGAGHDNCGPVLVARLQMIAKASEPIDVSTMHGQFRCINPDQVRQEQRSSANQAARSEPRYPGLQAVADSILHEERQLYPNLETLFRMAEVRTSSNPHTPRNSPKRLHSHGGYGTEGL